MHCYWIGTPSELRPQSKASLFFTKPVSCGTQTAIIAWRWTLTEWKQELRPRPREMLYPRTPDAPASFVLQRERPRLVISDRYQGIGDATKGFALPCRFYSFFLSESRKPQASNISLTSQCPSSPGIAGELDPLPLRDVYVVCVTKPRRRARRKLL